VDWLKPQPFVSFSLPNHNFLFSGAARTDVLTICDYIDEYYSNLQEGEVLIDVAALTDVINSCINKFPHPCGCDDSSPFKKAATFTTYFVNGWPIRTPITSKEFREGACKDLAMCQNAIVAFDFCVDALHGAKLQRADKEITLQNRISVSLHFWKDLILALSSCAPSSHFQHISLLYEAMAYQANPDASYPRVT
jgi:hypothetical protein